MFIASHDAVMTSKKINAFFGDTFVLFFTVESLHYLTAFLIPKMFLTHNVINKQNLFCKENFNRK